MFSVPQYNSTELQQYNYFVMQEPVFESETKGPVYTHVYEENGVLYCASSTSERGYYYTYALNNPLIYTDPSGYMYDPAEHEPKGPLLLEGQKPIIWNSWTGYGGGQFAGCGFDYESLASAYNNSMSYRPPEAGPTYDYVYNWGTGQYEEMYGSGSIQATDFTSSEYFNSTQTSPSSKNYAYSPIWGNPDIVPRPGDVHNPYGYVNFEIVGYELIELDILSDLFSENSTWLNTANNANLVLGSATGIFAGNYGLTANQTFRYGIRQGGRVISAQQRTAVHFLHSMKVARALGRINIITGTIGVGYSANQFIQDLNNGGWDQVDPWDIRYD